MKSYLQLFLFIIGCFYTSCIFGQDSLELYSIKFSGYKTQLSTKAKATLSDVAKTMRSHPGWHFAVTGCGATENQRLNKVSWDRMNNTIIHLVERQGINADRFVFKYGPEAGDYGIIELAFTEERITTDRPPHPNLRKKNNQLPCPPDSSSANY